MSTYSTYALGGELFWSGRIRGFGFHNRNEEQRNGNGFCPGPSDWQGTLARRVEGRHDRAVLCGCQWQLDSRHARL